MPLLSSLSDVVVADMEVIVMITNPPMSTVEGREAASCSFAPAVHAETPVLFVFGVQRFHPKHFDQVRKVNFRITSQLPTTGRAHPNSELAVTHTTAIFIQGSCMFTE